MVQVLGYRPLTNVPRVTAGHSPLQKGFSSLWGEASSPVDKSVRGDVAPVVHCVGTRGVTKAVCRYRFR